MKSDTLRLELRRSLAAVIILMIFIVGFSNKVYAQDKIQDAQIFGQDDSSNMRIIISTTGPAKFDSYWLDDPYRLVIEFKSKNVIGEIDDEIVVNNSVIKKITSSYFTKRHKALKKLTFELWQKLQYEIRQEDNAILLNIRAPLGQTLQSQSETRGVFGKEDEIFAKSKTNKAIIERLEVMNVALEEIQVAQPAAEVLSTEENIYTAAKSPENIVEEVKTKNRAITRQASQTAGAVKKGKSVMGIIFWFFGLALISGLGLLLWHKFKLFKDKRFNKLQLELQEKQRRLEQEEIIRKAIEEASLNKEKEINYLKDSLKTLRSELEKDGLVRRELSSEEKEKPWIFGKSNERRFFPRLALTKDFSQTVILRIETDKVPQGIKCFAKNISLEGLAFETTREFEQKEPVNLRLFFYGDRVPIIKIQAHIIWKKQDASVNHCGIYFDLIDEKEKLELKHYLEEKIIKPNLPEA